MAKNNAPPVISKNTKEKDQGSTGHGKWQMDRPGISPSVPRWGIKICEAMGGHHGH
jgi:hypothetical protein